MDAVAYAYKCLMLAAVVVLAVLIVVSMVRSVRGPRIADRIIAVNMIGTMVIMIIAILSVYLDENYLVDICLIYAMISFLGVVVLCKVYTGVYLKDKKIQANMAAIEANLESQQGQPGRQGKESQPGQPGQPGCQGKANQPGQQGQPSNPGQPAPCDRTETMVRGDGDT